MVNPERNIQVVKRFSGYAFAVILGLSALAFPTAGGQGPAPHSPENFDQVLQSAQEALARKDFVRAAQEYGQAAKIQPSPEIYEKLGLANYLANNFPDAARALSESIRLDPRRWGSQLYLGISLYKMNRFREALPRIQQAHELNPKQNETRYWLGCTYHALGNYDLALEHLQTALNEDPENVDILYVLAEAYLDLSMISAKRAGPLLQNLQRREALEEKLGINAFKKARATEAWDQAFGQWRSLGKQYKIALESPEQDDTSLCALNRIYREIAQLMAERVWRLKPNSYRAHQLRGETFEGYEKYEAAIREYRQALVLAPNAPGLNYLIGHAYWKMQRFDDALPELEKELVLNPTDAWANYVLGHIFLMRRDLERAARHLRIAVEAKPDFSEARKHLAKALSLMENHQGAARELELAAASDPDDDSVHYILAGVYKKMGLAEKAQKELEIFRRLSGRKHSQSRQPAE